MLDKTIGRIKNIKYNSDTKDMEVTLIVTDNKFKKKLLRDMALSGIIKIKGEQISFTSNTKSNTDG
jgi:hypothetical protein